MGQNLTKIPFKDSFWKGTTRTRPRESQQPKNQFISWPLSTHSFAQSAAWNGKMFCASLQINLNVAFEISTDFSDFI